jgi:hypothetical protein
VALLGEREHFGECSALHDREVEPATVAVATESTELYCIDQASLEQAMDGETLRVLTANGRERQVWQDQRWCELTDIIAETRLPIPAAGVMGEDKAGPA